MDRATPASYGGDGTVARELRRRVLCWRGGAREGSGAVARRGWSMAAWARGGRRRVAVARRCKGTAAHGWRAEEAQEAAALARARRDEGEQMYGLRLNSSPHATEKELEKGVLKPREIH